MNTEKQIINILLDDILDFHQQLTDRYRMESGIHDMNLLQSAVNSPFQSFAGQDLYPTIFDKASRLCYGLTKNHPFNDGNKRTAIHSMLVYLYINDILLDYESIELENIIIDIASSKMSCEELTQWLQDHVKKSKLKLDKKNSPSLCYQHNKRLLTIPVFN